MEKASESNTLLPLLGSKPRPTFLRIVITSERVHLETEYSSSSNLVMPILELVLKISITLQNKACAKVVVFCNLSPI